MQNNRPQSTGEEIANSILHGLGALLSLIGLVLLLFNSKSTLQTITSFVFGLSLFLLYMMSTLHHSLINHKAKQVFLVLDYSAIYLVIAATFTPFIMLVTKIDKLSNLLILISIWILAILGITLSAIFNKKIKTIAPFFYITMGWVSLLILPQIYQKSGLTITGLLINGGILYTLGTHWYLKDIRKYHHTVWHAHVLIASLLHFIAIYMIK